MVNYFAGSTNSEVASKIKTAPLTIYVIIVLG